MTLPLACPKSSDVDLDSAGAAVHEGGRVDQLRIRVQPIYLADFCLGPSEVQMLLKHSPNGLCFKLAAVQAQSLLGWMGT